MPPYAYKPSTFNGTSIQTAQYKSYFLIANSPVQTGPASPVEAVIAGLGTRFVRRQPGPATWRLVVNLAAINESDLVAFYRLFSKELGLAGFVATDGDGTAWRVQAEVLAHELQSPTQFHVVLRVPDPRWQSSTEVVDTDLAVSGDTHDFILTNAGTLDALPTVQWTPKAAKATKGILTAYRYTCRGFWANRSANAWPGLPVLLTDVAGADSPLDHAAKIQPDSTISNQINKIGGITATDTTIPIDTNGAGGGLPQPAGIAYISSVPAEQFSYSGNDGSNLTGCVRGIGGFGAAAHADNVVIYKSESLINADDVRVYMEGLEIPSWVDGYNTAAMRVWACPSAPGRVDLTIVKAMTAADPPGAGSIRFNEQVDDLPPKGHVVIDNELIYYDSRAGYTINTILRGMWGSTAASHTAGTRAYRCDGRYHITCGRADATGSAPRPAATRPAIQLKASRNNKWYWGDESDDASTVIYDPDRPNRPAMWAPGFDADGNAVSPLMQMSASKTSLEFKDDVPGEATPSRNYAHIYLPQGIKAATNAITADWTPAERILNQEMWGADASGTQKLLDELQQKGGLVAARNYTPVAVLHELKLKARMNSVTGLYSGTQTATYIVIANASAGGLAVEYVCATRFVIAQDTYVEDVLARLSAVSTMTISGTIVTDNSGAPGSTYVINPLAAVSIDSATPYVYRFLLQKRTWLPAGLYWLVLWKTDVFATGCYWYATGGSNPVNWTQAKSGRLEAGSWNYAKSEGLLDFEIVTAYDSKYEAPVQKEMPLGVPGTWARTGKTASFDKIILTLNDATADPYTPYVNRVEGWSSNCYHLKGNLWNTARPTDVIAVDTMLITKLNNYDSFQINIDSRLAEWMDGATGLYWPMAGAAVPVNAAQPLRLSPGSNTLTWAEAGMANTDIEVRFRSVKE